MIDKKVVRNKNLSVFSDPFCSDADISHVTLVSPRSIRTTLYKIFYNKTLIYRGTYTIGVPMSYLPWCNDELT